MRKSAEEIADEMDPHDGFGVQQADAGEGHSVTVLFRAGGVPVMRPWEADDADAGVSVWSATGNDPETLGEEARARVFVEAACRFLNTGGSMSEMYDLLDRTGSFFRDNDAGTVAAGIAGYHLVDTALNTDGTYEHVFAPDDRQGRYLRWVEGQFVDAISATQFANDMEEASRAETDGAFGIAPAASGAAEAGGAPQLPGGESDSAEAEAS